MSHAKKRVPLFVKAILFFITILFNFSLYANDRVVYLDQVSIDSLSFCTETDCFFPRRSLDDKDIHIAGKVNWNEDKNLILHTKGNIVFEKNGGIISNKNGSIILKSGMEPGKKEFYGNTVKFDGDFAKIEMLGNGKVKIYYNPVRGKEEHKYHNPSYYFYEQHVKGGNLNAYMLVNDVNDLQNIGLFLHGDYALSQDINATETERWNAGKGFEPLKDESKNMPFSGNFDGNNYSIKGLFINRYKNDVGLFGMCGGRSILHNVIENLTLDNFNIAGDHYVGSLAGFVANSDLLNIRVINPTIKSRDVAGGLIGTTDRVRAESIRIIGDIKIDADENKGFVVGGASKSNITLLFETKRSRDDILGTYKLLGNQDKQTQICLESKDSQARICLKSNPFADQEYNGMLMVNQTDPTKRYILINPEILNADIIKGYVMHGEEIYKLGSHTSKNNKNKP